MTAEQFVQNYNKAAVGVGLRHVLQLNPPDEGVDLKNCQLVAAGGPVSFLLGQKNGLVRDYTMLDPIAAQEDGRALVIIHLVLGVVTGMDKKACGNTLRRLGFYDSRFLKGTKTKVPRGYTARVKVATISKEKYIMFQLLSTP